MNTVAQSVTNILAIGNVQQCFQKIAVRVQTIHDSLAVAAVEKRLVIRDCPFQHRFKHSGSRIAPGFKPRQRGFQLVASRRSRPARLIRNGLLFGKGDDGMKNAVAHKIEGERQGSLGGALEKSLIAGGAMGCEKSPRDDPGVEKIRMRRAGLEGKCVRRSVPRVVGQIGRSASGFVDRAEIGERAGCVAGDFGRNGGVPAHIGTVISCDAATWFLNSGVEKPTACLFENGAQFSIV
jgi:hypothetical protein